MSLHIDESVTSSSDNQVRAVSADRTDNDITIRWDLLQDNGKAFNLHARRSDGMATYLLSPGGLDPSARSLVLSAQALSSPCVEFYLKQLTPNTPPAPPTESAASAGALFHAVIETPGEGCPGIGSPPTPGPDQFVNRFHDRDHLGTLRLVTSDSGTVVQALDFYPFGMEMAFSEIGGSSARKYAGHERDEETGLDYMMARYKGVADGAFLSLDPIRAASVYAPNSWNRYTYVLGNPVSFLDPSGLYTEEVTVTTTTYTITLEEYCWRWGCGPVGGGGDRGCTMPVRGGRLGSAGDGDDSTELTVLDRCGLPPKEFLELPQDLRLAIIQGFDKAAFHAALFGPLLLTEVEFAWKLRPGGVYDFKSGKKPGSPEQADGRMPGNMMFGAVSGVFPFTPTYVSENLAGLLQIVTRGPKDGIFHWEAPWGEKQETYDQVQIGRRLGEWLSCMRSME